MLVTLISAITVGLDTAIAKSLLITHFGLFLLWQPIFKQEVSFNISSLLFLLLFITLFIAWVNLWAMTFWLLLLSSLLNGRIFARGLNRATYALAVIILFLELILVVTPNLFQLPGIQDTVQTSINLLLMFLAIPLLLIPTNIQISTHVDFIRGFMIVLLTLFICMGSVLATLTTNQPYINALVSTTLIAALFLFSASYLWAPRAGFAGIAQLWEKYLLNIGGPFEQWISRLSVLDINQKITPDAFLHFAIKSLLERHWISGIYWRTALGENTEGTSSENSVEYDDPKLYIKLYSNSTIGPALMLHSKLLFSVLTFYYKAKLQEEQLVNQAHLKAIYETGSKLTHDVKNILQGTQTLAQIVEDETDNHDSRQLLKKQLPILTQRLRSTLDKLTDPVHSESGEGKLTDWWQAVVNRYKGRQINFSEDVDVDFMVYTDILDSIVENIIENARQKRSVESEIEIQVSLTASTNQFKVSVCDNGSPIAADIEKVLFTTLTPSENGYGIGLYQSFQQAQSVGYQLSIASNQAQRVCFEIDGKNKN